MNIKQDNGIVCRVGPSATTNDVIHLNDGNGFVVGYWAHHNAWISGDVTSEPMTCLECIAEGGPSKPVPPYKEKVKSSHGAPMGRGDLGMLRGKVYLHPVPLFDGGYDQGGAYWGTPNDLWCAWNWTGVRYIRAESRDAAKNKLEGCVFFR